MAWTIDTNFGSTLTTSTAESPFPTGGGNRMLGFGSGVVYRDDIDELNIEISMDIVCTLHGDPGGGANSPILIPFLIARRQPDGSFYAAGYSQANNFSGGGAGRLLLTIYHYNGTSDTFTILNAFILPSTNSLAPNEGDLLKFFFRLSENSLNAKILNNSNQTVAEVGSVDSSIDTSGNTGVGGRIDGLGTPVSPLIFADNWKTNII